MQRGQQHRCSYESNRVDLRNCAALVVYAHPVVAPATPVGANLPLGHDLVPVARHIVPAEVLDAAASEVVALGVGVPALGQVCRGRTARVAVPLVVATATVPSHGKLGQPLAAGALHRLPVKVGDM